MSAARAWCAPGCHADAGRGVATVPRHARAATAPLPRRRAAPPRPSERRADASPDALYWTHSNDS
jgi:hypothetical protein